MKNIILACLTILLLTWFLYSEIPILKLLEAGKFEEVRRIINSASEKDHLVTFYNSLYHLYLGDYTKAAEYVVRFTSYSMTDEQQFFVSYILNLKQIFSNGYNEYESDHFKIYLKGRDVILKDFAILQLEKIYKTFGEKFGFYPERKVRIEVYNTKEEFAFASTLGMDIIEKTGVVGICKFNRIMILSPECLPFGYRWLDTLAHEYIHFILNHISEYSLPLYLHEATARYYDTLYRSTEPLCFSAGNVNLLLQAKMSNKIIPFSSFKGSLVYLDSQQEIDLAFVELASFVKHLVENYGENNFLQFIKHYKNYKDDEDKLYNKIYGLKFDKLMSLWEDNLELMFTNLSSYPGAQPDWKCIYIKQQDELLGLDQRQYIELGDKFLAKKDYKTAIFQYKKAQKFEMFNPIVLTRLAKAYLAAKMYEEAEDILNQCISANPNFVAGYELLFNVYFEKGEYEKALDVYKQILEINPFNYKIRKTVAEIYSDLGKLEHAIDEYKIVKVLNPTDADVDVRIDTLNRYLEIKKLQRK
ncbi:MAG: tetratricopeptide repeat protein [Endomicrobia bacterium]|nr:tetratricopeptide repeat protein [Endomicrobiia bacterium]MDW8055537.1 tetratricopeptide repeat protein [Elusimicrobiota bacterium]